MKLLVFIVGLATCNFVDDSVPLGHKDPQIQRDQRGPTPCKCQNGGSCQQTSTGVQCMCRYGYTGASCETETSYDTSCDNIPEKPTPEGVPFCASSYIQNMVYNRSESVQTPVILAPYLYAWPNGLVPYGFDDSPNGDLTWDQRKRVICAMEFFLNETDKCIKFRRLPMETLRSSNHDYLLVTKPRGDIFYCAADVYRPQPNKTVYRLILYERCFNYSLGLIIHELMHTLGRQHEHQRSDRDTYIQVNETLLKTYVKLPYLWREWCKLGDLGLDEVRFHNQEYDFDSIMHYPNFVNYDQWNNIPIPEIIFAPVKNNWNKKIRQRYWPTLYDMYVLKTLYGCYPNVPRGVPMLYRHVPKQPEDIPDYCKVPPFQLPPIPLHA